MLSPQFSVQRPAFLKTVFQCESFDIGLIRVGESPEFTIVTSTMSRLNFCTYLTHCAIPPQGPKGSLSLGVSKVFEVHDGLMVVVFSKFQRSRLSNSLASIFFLQSFIGN